MPVTGPGILGSIEHAVSPVTDIPGGAGTILHAVSPVTDIPGVSSPLTGLSAVGDFFSRLGQASTWIRVGEVALGLILIAVGIAKLTRAVPVATTIAKAIP